MAEIILDFFVDHIFPWLLIIMGIFLLLLFLYIPFGIYFESKEESFSLKKKDWACTKAHNEQNTNYVMSGKILRSYIHKKPLAVKTLTVLP